MIRKKNTNMITKTNTNIKIKIKFLKENIYIYPPFEELVKI